MRFLQIFVSVFLSLVLALDLNDTLRLRYLNNQDYIQFGLTFQTKEIVSRNIYNYLPRQIANLIFENDISNFEMSLSRGDWYYDVDLEDPHFSDYIFGHGGFLKAKSKSGAFSDSVWTKFTNSLGGMTCASFNQITSVVTGVDSEGNYFGQLPVEAICTENLTPWKKLLLNTRNIDHSLLRFIDSYKLATANYFGLAIRVSVKDLPDNKYEVTMTNILSSVFPNSNSKNQPVENLPDLTFLSSVDLKLQPLDENFTSVILPLDRDVNLNVGDGKITQVDHIKVFQPLHEKISENLSHQDLTIKRWQSSNGRGQLGGKINLEITRNCVVKSEPINLKITELYPWCITPFYSTFTEQTKVKASNIFWQPGVINEKPNHINYQISIKCGQTYSNSLDYEAKILGWTKYPADAERGIFINPSIIEINQNPDQTLFASGLIIDVPKPDFSMPFNALCLACTAVAILFGNLHMILTKPVDVASEKNEKFISKVFKKIGALLKRKKD